MTRIWSEGVQRRFCRREAGERPSVVERDLGEGNSLLGHARKSGEGKRA